MNEARNLLIECMRINRAYETEQILASQSPHYLAKIRKDIAAEDLSTRMVELAEMTKHLSESLWVEGMTLLQKTL